MTKCLRFGIAAAWGMLVVPLLFTSSAVAFRIGSGDPALGEPLVGEHLYAPHKFVEWWRAWGEHTEFRERFWQGVALSFLPSLIAFGSLALRAASEAATRPRASVEPGAQLGTADDLLRSPTIATDGDGVVIGKRGSKLLRARGDQHLMVLGPSGSGKGVGVVIPTLLEDRGPMLVHDPKRSLARICGRWRASLGPTFVFDPTSRHSHTFNPLLEVRDGDHRHGDCEAVATLIAMSKSASDPVWEKSATKLYTALLLTAFEHGAPTLGYVNDLFHGVCIGRYPEVARGSFAQEAFAEHAAYQEKIRTSINLDLAAATRFVSDPVVRHVTSRSEFWAGDLFCGERPTTVFITVPPADRERLNPLLRLVLQTIGAAGLRDVHLTGDGRRKVWRPTFLFEEFAALGHMEFLETNTAECREYGIRVVLVAQDIDQIRREPPHGYGRHQSITPNMGTIVVMPGFSQTSLETIETWGGQAVRTSRSRGREMLKPLSVRMSESEEYRPVINAAELLANRTQQLVFHAGCKPAWVDRVRYYEERTFDGRYDAA